MKIGYILETHLIQENSDSPILNHSSMFFQAYAVSLMLSFTSGILAPSLVVWSSKDSRQQTYKVFEQLFNIVRFPFKRYTYQIFSKVLIFQLLILSFQYNLEGVFAISSIYIYRKNNRTAPVDAVGKRNDLIHQPKGVADSRSHTITIIQPNKRKETKTDEALSIGYRSRVHKVEGQQNGR